jgi:hypothetical protein
MTLQEFLDQQRFPLTTQPGLTPHEQLMMSAFNYDKFEELADSGELLPGKPTAIWAELQEKGPHIARLTAELRAAEVASEGGGSDSLRT